jgi:hypothetical protein
MTEYSLSEKHPLLAGMATVERSGTRTQWIPRDTLERVVQENYDMKRTLALINVAHTFGENGLQIRQLLDKHDETEEQAAATRDVIYSVTRHKNSKDATSAD